MCYGAGTCAEMAHQHTQSYKEARGRNQAWDGGRLHGGRIHSDSARYSRVENCDRVRAAAFIHSRDGHGARNEHKSGCGGRTSGQRERVMEGTTKMARHRNRSLRALDVPFERGSAYLAIRNCPALARCAVERPLRTIAEKHPLAGAGDRLAHAREVELVATEGIQMFVHQWGRQCQRGVIDRVALGA